MRVIFYLQSTCIIIEKNITFQPIEWSYGMPLCQNHFSSLLCVCVCVCVCVCLFVSKKNGNCPTSLKRVCCVQYNLHHPSLKVIMVFKWSCNMPLCQNLFPSPLCVCVCVFLKNTKIHPFQFIQSYIKIYGCYSNCVNLHQSFSLYIQFFILYLHILRMKEESGQ